MGANAKMLKCGSTDATRGCSYLGCSCCNPKRVRRAAKKGVKLKQKAAWKREAAKDLS